MSAQRWWTDDELGRLEDMADLTASEVAAALGRTRKQVLHKRQALRRGVERRKEPISQADLDFVADYAHFTTEEIARHLGRSKASVAGIRTKLRRDGVIGKTPTVKSPWHCADRTLVARSCSECGLLLDQSWFYPIGKAKPGYRQPHCRKCQSNRNRRRGAKAAASARSFALKLQAATLETATSYGKEWTGADIAVLEDKTKTVFEKAVTLGRTYFATASQLSNRGLRDPKPEVGDPTEAQWFITLRSDIAKALEAVAA